MRLPLKWKLLLICGGLAFSFAAAEIDEVYASRARRSAQRGARAGVKDHDHLHDADWLSLHRDGDEYRTIVHHGSGPEAAEVPTTPAVFAGFSLFQWEILPVETGIRTESRSPVYARPPPSLT